MIDLTVGLKNIVVPYYAVNENKVMRDTGVLPNPGRV